jgi:hypothetical protein
VGTLKRLPHTGGPRCSWCGHALESLPESAARYCPCCEPSAPYSLNFECDDESYQVRDTDYPIEDET